MVIHSGVHVTVWFVFFGDLFGLFGPPTLQKPSAFLLFIVSYKDKVTTFLRTSQWMKFRAEHGPLLSSGGTTKPYLHDDASRRRDRLSDTTR